MSFPRRINTDHSEMIHDVAYNFYGTRMATCSSDQTVRIWEAESLTDEWYCTASWKAHEGLVWRVTWASPEFGDIIATCSFDWTACIWEEVAKVGKIEDGEASTYWVRRATMSDSKGNVTDVKFAPKYLGLVLATCSTDGKVRIYETPDHMNIGEWSLRHEIIVKMPCCCLSWNPTFPELHSPMFAVGSDDKTIETSKVVIYEFNKILSKWNQILNLDDVTDPVNEVAFAPNLGRSYHLLGIASETLKIIMLEPWGEPSNFSNFDGFTKLEVRTAANCTDHKSTVWRVTWNVSGTMLSSSGDDGCVRQWKGSFLGGWKCISTIRGDKFDKPIADSSESGLSLFGTKIAITTRGDNSSKS